MIDLEAFLDELGVVIRSKRGYQWWASCPLPTHRGHDRTPSFTINADKKVYYCFACDEGGSIQHLVHVLLGTDGDAYVAKFDNSGEDAFVKMIDGYLTRDVKPSPIPVLPWNDFGRIEPFLTTETDWFSQRRINDEARRLLKLGYDPLRTRTGFSYQGPVVLIPHFFKGECVGWQERWVDYEKDWQGPPKYTNTPEFPKKFTLYNYDLAAAHDGMVILCESAMTVAVLLSLGYVAMATFGGSVSQQQLRLLRGFDKGLALAYDNDDTGKRTTQDLIKALDRYVPLEIIPTPAHEKADLADVSYEEIEWLLEKSIPSFLRGQT